MLEIQDVSEEVQRWSQQLQRRVIRLLLQHDAPLFRSQFRLFFAQSKLPAIPLLRQYDRYIKLQMFSHELLDDILPRIRRQLSLKTNHVRLREEAPTRGDIDWLRSLEQSWHHTPGLPPQQFETRLRQRSMETSENLLTVALLLTYCQELQQAMDDLFEDEELNMLEKQVLTSAYEQIRRELAAPYARALLERAQQAHIPELVHQVTLQLRPGPSPYRDLLTWWQNFTQFHIGRSSAERSITLASTRSDEKTDAWLYELWIVLECMHLLQGEDVIQPQDITVATDLLQFTFSWQRRRFRFLYNRQLETATNGSMPTWEHAPPSRPDYTIERERPLEISDHGASIWREPPVLLDAKYYLEGNDPARTHEPIKKLLGDMALIGAGVGALFFPRLPEPDADQQITRTIRQSDRQYQARQQVQQIHLYHLDPSMSFPNLQKRLHALLDMVVQHLPERPAPACQGFLLDADTVNASKQALPMLRVVCPKPHIGPDVFDLVNREEHCLKDARLCHVKGQLILPPQVMRVHTLDELKGHIQQIRTFGEEALKQATEQDDQVEQFHSHILNRVGTMIEQYVQAQGGPISKETAEELYATIPDSKGKPGILRWLVENLDPKK